MAGGSTMFLHVRALLFKNALVTRRFPITSCCQCCCPMLAAFIFVIPFLFITSPFEFTPAQTYHDRMLTLPSERIARGSSGGLELGSAPPLLAGCAAEIPPMYLQEAGPRDGISALFDALQSRAPEFYHVSRLDEVRQLHYTAFFRPQRPPVRRTLGLAPQTALVEELRAAMQRRLAAESLVEATYGALDACPPVAPGCTDLWACVAERLEVKLGQRSGCPCNGTALRAHPSWAQLEPKLTAWVDLAMAKVPGPWGGPSQSTLPGNSTCGAASSGHGTASPSAAALLADIDGGACSRRLGAGLEAPATQRARPTRHRRSTLARTPPPSTGPVARRNLRAAANASRGAEARRLFVDDCGTLASPCACAERAAECFWSRSSSRCERPLRDDTSAAPGTSCSYCASQPGCEEADLWRGMGLLALQRPVLRIFPTAEALQQHMAGEGYPEEVADADGGRTSSELCAALVLDSQSCVGGGGDCEYTMRVDPMKFEADFNAGQRLFPDMRSWLAYSQLAPLQKWIDDFLLAAGVAPGTEAPRPSYHAMMFPVAAQRKTALRYFYGTGLQGDAGLATILVWGTLLVAASTPNRALREKEQQLREGMRMMGLSDPAYYVAQLLWVAAWSMLPSAVVTIILYQCLTKHCDGPACEYRMGELFSRSNGFWFFLLYWLGCIAQACIGLVAVPLVARARTGRMLGIGVMFLYLLLLPVADPRTAAARTACGLVPGVALVQGVRHALVLEDTGIGLTAASLGLEIDSYTFGASLYMLFVDILLYGLLYMYFDQVSPYGVGHRHPLFFLTRGFWRDVLGRRGAAQPEDPEVSLVDGCESNSRGDAFEPPSEALMAMSAAGKTLEVRGLRKRFSDFMAVDGVDLTMYPGEVYVLLGHNGAGKTTTIGCLTGLLSPTSGSASLFGRPLWSVLRTVEGRAMVGICPQHNVLWSEFSCMEHCRLFGAFRGLRRSAAADGGAAILAETGLAGKVTAAAGTLSGGMKRKLALSLALLGEPALCFLDEPTSGMDPTARRDTWDLIRRQREGRIICLTTHYMDEADVLGDRIGIMASGRLRCMGPPPFLKRCFGCGYNLSFELAGEAGRSNDIVDLVSEELRGGEGAKVMAQGGGSLVLLLDFSASAHFPALFARLDDGETRARLGLAGWSIAVCHLEEVFVRVARGEHGAAVAVGDSPGGDKAAGQQPSPDVIGAKVDPETAAAAGDVLELRPSMGRQAAALLSKRMVCTRRDPMAIFCQVLCPMLFAIFTMGGLVAGSDDHPRMVFDIADLSSAAQPQIVLPMGSVAGGDATLSRAFADAARSPPSFADEVQELLLASVKGSELERCALPVAEGLSAALLDTQGSLAASRFVAAAPLSSDALRPSLLVASNTTTEHGLPAALNLGANLVRRVLGVAGSVRAAIHPFPLTAEEKADRYGAPSVLRTLGGIMPCWVLPLSMVVGAAFVMREKEAGVKTQHSLSGVGPGMYWSVNLLADFVLYFISVGLVAIVLAAFGLETDIGGVFFACLLLFGFAQIAFSYFVGSLFSTASVAQSAILAISLVSAGILGLVALLFRGTNLCWQQEGRSPLSFAPGAVCERAAYEIWNPLFSFIPGVAAWEAMDIMSEVLLIQKAVPLSRRTAEWYAQCARGVEAREIQRWRCADGVLEWDAAGRSLLQLPLIGVLYLVLVVCIDSLRAHPKLRSQLLDFRAGPVPKPEGWEDTDVLEQASTMPGPLESACRVLRVRKVYGPVGLRRLRKNAKIVHAVKGVSFAIRRGEVFGLLGSNGAGKTSLFDMLAGVGSPTEGELHVDGEDMRTGAGAGRARRRIGYCPQGNALLERMTAREHLVLYCQLKGVPRERVGEVVEAKLQHIGLQEHARKYAADLSGGNKRKLMTAMALIGDPPIVLADEPSAGMDPLARRSLWSVVRRVTAQRRCSVLLSTHSMEECEASCQRSAIMVNGVFRTIGTNRHIKERYGNGFELMAKVSRPTEGALLAVMRSWQLPEDTSQGVMRQSQLRDLYAGDAYMLAALGGPTSPWSDEHTGVSLRVAAEWHLLTTAFRGVHALAKDLAGGGTAQLTDWHGQMSRYTLATERKLVEVFAKVEEAKEGLSIEEYSCSSTSLEQIFNRFAREQESVAPHAGGASPQQVSPEPQATVARFSQDFLALAVQPAPTATIVHPASGKQV